MGRPQNLPRGSKGPPSLRRTPAVNPVPKAGSQGDGVTSPISALRVRAGTAWGAPLSLAAAGGTLTCDLPPRAAATLTLPFARAEAPGANVLPPRQCPASGNAALLSPVDSRALQSLRGKKERSPEAPCSGRCPQGVRGRPRILSGQCWCAWGVERRGGHVPGQGARGEG